MAKQKNGQAEPAACQAGRRAQQSAGRPRARRPALPGLLAARLPVTAPHAQQRTGRPPMTDCLHPHAELHNCGHDEAVGVNVVGYDGDQAWYTTNDTKYIIGRGRILSIWLYQ